MKGANIMMRFGYCFKMYVRNAKYENETNKTTERK